MQKQIGFATHQKCPYRLNNTLRKRIYCQLHLLWIISECEENEQDSKPLFYLNHTYFKFFWIIRKQFIDPAWKALPYLIKDPICCSTPSKYFVKWQNILKTVFIKSMTFFFITNIRNLISYLDYNVVAVSFLS